MENQNIMELFGDFTDMISRINIMEKLLSVILTLFVVVISVKIIRFVIKRFFRIKHIKTQIAKEEKRRETIERACLTFSKMSIWLIGILVICSYFIDIGAILAVAGVGTLAIGYGAKGLVEDVTSGFIVLLEDQYSVGDYVSVEGIYGQVESLGVRTTEIRQMDQSMFIVHNGKVDKLINYSKGPISASVDVGVAYEVNINYVLEVLEEICTKIQIEKPEIFPTKPKVLGITRMDPSALNFKILAEQEAEQKWLAERILRQKIKETFDEKGIEIPYDKTIVYTQPLEGD